MQITHQLMSFNCKECRVCLFLQAEGVERTLSFMGPQTGCCTRGYLGSVLRDSTVENRWISGGGPEVVLC